VIEIIPAIDIIDGECVRLTQGEFSSRKVYERDPLAMARRFEAAGLRRLHLVDLDGAKARKVVNLRVLETIASGTDLIIDFGGGVQSDEDIRSVFSAGAEMVTAGSIAVRSADTVEEWLAVYGAGRIILGADVLDGRIAVHAWQESSAVGVQDFLQDWWMRGMRSAVCTDVSRDGMLGGPAAALYRSIMDRLPELQLTASGGVSCMDDVLALENTGARAVIVGKAIYEGRISWKELEAYVQTQRAAEHLRAEDQDRALPGRRENAQ